MSPKLVKFSAFAASGFCLVAGAVLIVPFLWTRKFDDITMLAFGLYFLGKACFVGPMLHLASRKLSD